MKPTFFTSAPEFRKWLSRNHASSKELFVGFHKTSSSKRGLTYAEALDEALCFGWIDGVRRNFNVISYTIRFSPRKPASIWSLINVGHARRLIRNGKMKPPGLSVFRSRDKKKSQIYSYEVRGRPLEAKYAKRFKANPQAWTFFRSQAPSYQKVACWWIISAKQEETRIRRLDSLIASSANGQRLDRFLSNK